MYSRLRHRNNPSKPRCSLVINGATNARRLHYDANFFSNCHRFSATIRQHFFHRYCNLNNEFEIRI